MENVFRSILNDVVDNGGMAYRVSVLGEEEGHGGGMDWARGVGGGREREFS